MTQEQELVKDLPVEETTESVETEGNNTGISDKSFEALITDPNFILRDFRGLCEKHNIGFVDLMNDMGFDARTLRALLVNKPITEQIYTLSRELSIIIYKMGMDSDPTVDTLDVRTTLGNTGDSEEFLELLDTFVFPYMAEYVNNGKLNPDWIVPKDPAAEIQEAVAHQINVNNEMNKAVDDAQVYIDELSDLEDRIELTQGEESVAAVSEEQLEKVIQKVQNDGDIVVEEDDGDGDGESSTGDDHCCDPA